MVKKKSKKKKNKDLSQDIISNIQSIHFLYERQRDATLSALSISNEQFNVLNIVKEGKNGTRSLKQIQASLPNKTSNTTRLVHKLHLKNLVTKKVVENDKRALSIALTESGSTLLNQAEGLMSGLKKHLKKSTKDIQETDLLENLITIKKKLK